MIFMWNQKRSITLSKCCVVLFAAALAVVAIRAKWLIFFLRLNTVPEYFLITVYVGCIPAVILLWNLFFLLHRIENDEVFIQRNVESLRRISWSCIAGGFISFASGFYYIPWFVVALAAAFMGLIVRIIKNVVAQAVELKNDSDFTI
jgi:hypothetical protein